MNDVCGTVRGSFRLLGVVVGLLLCPPAMAAPVPVVHSVQEKLASFGNLSQQDVTVCPNTACGPVAAINSFVFLQREYPTIYGSRLIPSVDGTHPTTAELVAAADNLAKNYMDTCCQKGTHITNFVNGKQKYFDTVAPNTTLIHGQVKDWDPVEGGALPGNIDETDPTPQFLLNELSHNQDIELLIDFGANEGHYITLTSLDWTDADGDGTIDVGEAAKIGYIDPQDGKQGTAQIGQANGVMTVQYTNPVTHMARGGTIFGAIAESPELRTNPEPASAALVLVALVAVWRVRQQSTAARSVQRRPG